jgi:hypothetical protein
MRNMAPVAPMALRGRDHPWTGCLSGRVFAVIFIVPERSSTTGPSRHGDVNYGPLATHAGAADRSPTSGK